MPASPVIPSGALASGGAIVATDLTHGYADRVVLRDVAFSVAPGRRLALVGDNGSGKSTLLRLLSGMEQPDEGEVVRPEDTALLEQDLAHGPETTIGDVVESALADLREAARQVQELSELVQRIPDDAALAREYGDALEWAQLRGAWDADHRVDRVMRGLGLDHMPRTRRIAALSGGERARVAMAVLLVLQPRALLLDEPTNHLDDTAVGFLERHLLSLPGVVVVASHDRAFLDATCDELLDLDPARGGPVRFGGRFSEYLVHRQRERDRWKRTWLERQRELAVLRMAAESGTDGVAHGRAPRDNDKFIAHFKGGRVERAAARRTRAAQTRIDQLERSPIARPPEPLRFRADMGAVAADPDAPLLTAAGLVVDDRLAPVDLVLQPGERLLVTGANGAGKSTLLEVLAGWLEPGAGSIEHREGLRVGYLPQDPKFADPLTTPNRLYRANRHDAAEDAPELVDLGLLREDDLDQPVGWLSEGQRRRLALALLVQHGPELLLLDEPTNHLSPALVSDLEDALVNASCAVVIATHDRWLRSRWTGPELHITAPARMHSSGPR